MIKLNACPCCLSTKLAVLRRRISKYDESFGTIEAADTNHILENIIRKRQVRLTLLLCRQCYHVFLSPSFDQTELKRLYSGAGMKKLAAFRTRAERALGLSCPAYYCGGDEKKARRMAEQSRRFRPGFIHETVTSLAATGISRVIDIGGGDGQNISSFRGDGRRLFVLDMAVPHKAADGCTVLKNYEQAYRTGPFDLLVLTHTLEHIVNAHHELEIFSQLLDSPGYVYVEVPYEVCRWIVRGPRLSWHVNYFSKISLGRLFASLGYSTILLQTRQMPYGFFRAETVVGLFTLGGTTADNSLNKTKASLPAPLAWAAEAAAWAGRKCRK